jgi:hypothetical protein
MIDNGPVPYASMIEGGCNEVLSIKGGTYLVDETCCRSLQRLDGGDAVVVRQHVRPTKMVGRVP